MISTIGSQSSSSAERKRHGGTIGFCFVAVFPTSSMYLTQGKRKTNICRVVGWMGGERLWLNQPINILICLSLSHTHTHTPFCIIWDLKDGKLWGFPGLSSRFVCEMLTHQEMARAGFPHTRTCMQRTSLHPITSKLLGEDQIPCPPYDS